MRRGVCCLVLLLAAAALVVAEKEKLKVTILASIARAALPADRHGPRLAQPACASDWQSGLVKGLLAKRAWAITATASQRCPATCCRHVPLPPLATA